MDQQSPTSIEFQFNQCISHLMELSEGMFRDHPHWAFYRKSLLKRLNELRREVVTSMARKGTEHEPSRLG